MRRRAFITLLTVAALFAGLLPLAAALANDSLAVHDRVLPFPATRTHCSVHASACGADWLQFKLEPAQLRPVASGGC
jgi:hypothetical protein